MEHPVARRYGKLSAHLADCGERGETRVVLTLTFIDTELRGRPLPATARHPRGHRQWWRATNGDYPHAWYGWQRVGWTVAAVDLATETVTFTRAGTARGDA